MSLQLMVVQFIIGIASAGAWFWIERKFFGNSNWLPLRRRDGNSASLFNCQWNQSRRFSFLLARHQP